MGRVMGKAGALFHKQSTAEEAYAMLAVAWSKRGGYKMAATSLLKALLLYPPSGALRLALARILHDDGHPDTAARVTGTQEAGSEQAAVLSHALLSACDSCATQRDHCGPPGPIQLQPLLRLVTPPPSPLEAGE